MLHSQKYWNVSTFRDLSIAMVKINLQVFEQSAKRKWQGNAHLVHLQPHRERLIPTFQLNPRQDTTQERNSP